MSEERSLRSIVAGLAEMGAVELRGQEFSGSYLACMVAVNPELPVSEAAKTPQLIAEFGRLAAAALRDKEVGELRYRVWRDSQVHEMTTDLEAAENAGLVVEDSKGKKKLPSRVGVETWLKTLPEYQNHYNELYRLTEVWATLHAAYEACKARQWAILNTKEIGADLSQRRGDDWDGNTYETGEGDLEEDLPEMENAVEQGERTPLPVQGGHTPPPPPGRNPPPPPERRS